MRRWLLPDDSTGHDPGPPRQRGRKAVTVQGGYGTCFCHPGTNFIEHYACRACPVRAQRVTGVQSRSEPGFITCYKFGVRHWRSVAVQII
jgi:hypothetical protein